MRRNNWIDAFLRRALLGRWVFAAPLVGAAAQPVLGHTLLVAHGDVMIESCSATVELEISAEDLEHWYRMERGSDGGVSVPSLRSILERHGRTLHQILVIRDADGRPLPSEPFDFQLDESDDEVIGAESWRALRVKYATRITYPSFPRFLTFQLWMAGEFPSVYWQTYFNVHGIVEAPGCVLRLTSRGNAETVEISWEGGQARILPQSSPGSVTNRLGLSGLRGISAEIDIGDLDFEIRVEIPLAMLSTWLTLPGHDEFLDMDEQRSVRLALENLLRPALSIESGGRELEAKVGGVLFRSLEGREAESPVHRVSLVTGRVTGIIRFRAEKSLEKAQLRWNLFNHAVLSVDGVIQGDGRTIRHTFSTYEPAYQWRRESRCTDD